LRVILLGRLKLVLFAACATVIVAGAAVACAGQWSALAWAVVPLVSAEIAAGAA
jgi:hypothetical protein